MSLFLLLTGTLGFEPSLSVTSFPADLVTSDAGRDPSTLTRDLPLVLGDGFGLLYPCLPHTFLTPLSLRPDDLEMKSMLDFIIRDEMIFFSPKVSLD